MRGTRKPAAAHRQRKGVPPSPAAPATAAAAPRDAAGAARREAVRAWNGARDLDEIPARVWARWRGAALARAGVRFAGGDGAGRPDFELAACAKVAHTDAARRWALTWRLCATAVAGSRVRVEFVATVVDADAARGAGPSLGTGAGGAGADGGWSGLVGALDDATGAAPDLPEAQARAHARCLAGEASSTQSEFGDARDALAALSLYLRAGDAGLRAWLARGGEAAGRALLLGLARALRPRAADLVDAQRREFAARPDLPPIGAEGDWAAVPALALHCVARACPRLPAEVAPWAERVGADVVRWCGEAPPDVRALALEAAGALGELQARGTRARPAPLADEFLGAAARAAAARHAATARGAVCALRGVALGLAPGAAAEVAALDALAPWVSAWLDAASRALAGDAAAAAACVEDAAAARYAVAACGDLWASVPRESADLARRATDALRAWTPAALAAAPAGVRAGLPVLALGRAAAAFYQTAAGRAALRDGDAAAVEARAREAGASNEDARAVRFALRGPARAAPPPGAPPDAARVCQAEWAAAHEARLAEHLRAPAEDADAVDALAYHLEAELRAGDDANAAAFACLLELSRKREAVLARLDAPTRGRVEALVADALRADPPPTDEDRAAFDHFRRTGEVLGAAPPAAAEE